MGRKTQVNWYRLVGAAKLNIRLRDDLWAFCMTCPLIRKLGQFTRLSVDDKRVLERAAGERGRQIGAHEHILREAEKPRAINLVLSGWATGTRPWRTAGARSSPSSCPAT